MAKSAVKSASPFDAIAAAPKVASKKSDKVAADVSDEIRKAVDIVVAHKAMIVKLDLERKQYEEQIIDHIRPQQDALARAGQFTKSLAVEGQTSSVTYVAADKFSVPKLDETDRLEALTKLLGSKKFEDWFTKSRTIALKPAVQENPDLINKIVAAVTAAGLDLAEAFEVTDVLKATKDLDQKQYELPPAKLEQFRTLVKQAKPALR